MRNLLTVFALALFYSGNLLAQGAEVESMASPHAEMPKPIEWVLLQLPVSKTEKALNASKAKPPQAPEVPGCRLIHYRPQPQVVLYQVEQLPEAESWCQAQKEQGASNVSTFTDEVALVSWCKKKWSGFNKAAFQAARTSTPKP